MRISYPWTAICVGVLGLGLVALPHLRFLGAGLVPVLQALIPAACIAALTVTVVLVVFRRLLAALVLIGAVVLAVVPALNPSAADLPAADASGEVCEQDRHITVLTLNVLGGGADLGAVAAQIRHYEPDAVVLTEADDSVMEVLLDHGIGDELPHLLPETLPLAPAGTAVLSAHPLNRGEQLPLRDDAFDHPALTLDHPQAGHIGLTAVHTHPPVQGADLWREDLEALGQWQRRQQGPLILAGDFNAGHSHALFRDATAGLDNTASASGRLPVPTWPAGGRIPAFTAIDHVLVRGLQPISWERFTVRGTDHYGVTAAVCAG